MINRLFTDVTVLWALFWMTPCGAAAALAHWDLTDQWEKLHRHTVVAFSAARRLSDHVIISCMWQQERIGLCSRVNLACSNMSPLSSASASLRNSVWTLRLKGTSTDIRFFPSHLALSPENSFMMSSCFQSHYCGGWCFALSWCVPIWFLVKIHHSMNIACDLQDALI